MSLPRRWLIFALTMGVVAVAAVAAAQSRGKIPRIGVLEPGPQQRASGCLRAFRQGLRDLGYVEGQNILVEIRYGEGRSDRLSSLAAELVRLTPDVLWTHSAPAGRATQQTTTTIPIVLGVTSELVEQGLAQSLPRPQGNVTGVELRDVELMGKRLALFKEALPTISRVAVLVDPADRSHDRVPGNIEAEARALGVQVKRVEAGGGPEGFEAVFAAMIHGRADGLMIKDTALFVAHRPRLLELAAKHRLPTISGTRGFAEAGSLLAYGAYVPELCRRSAAFVDKILKGAKPADLPVERADRFEFVINLRTARALGLTIPPNLFSRADIVIR